MPGSSDPSRSSSRSATAAPAAALLAQRVYASQDFSSLEGIVTDFLGRAEVAAQREDVPHDTAHPLYPFGFGLSY